MRLKPPSIITMENFRENVYHTYKTLTAIMSGYVSLNQKVGNTGKDDEDFVMCGPDTEALTENLYVLFGNGYRIQASVIFILESEYKLQEIVLRLFQWSKAYKDAYSDVETHIRSSLNRRIRQYREEEIRELKR
mgnify:CR=1 FL=1